MPNRATYPLAAITPVTTGSPAPGFAVASITVDPLVVTVSGDAEVLAELAAIETQPISLNGASTSFDVEAPLALPAGTEPVDVDAVQVVVSLRPVTATRNFEAGLELVGARGGIRGRAPRQLHLAVLGAEFLVQRVLLLEQRCEAAVHLEEGQVLLLQVEQLGKLRVHRCSCVEGRRARGGPPWKVAGEGAAASIRHRVGAPVPPGAAAVR